jgi:hypothetical protein
MAAGARRRIFSLPRRFDSARRASLTFETGFFRQLRPELDVGGTVFGECLGA